MTLTVKFSTGLKLLFYAKVGLVHVTPTDDAELGKDDKMCLCIEFSKGIGLPVS
jgi:hypothetical protein